MNRCKMRETNLLSVPLHIPNVASNLRFVELTAALGVRRELVNGASAY